MRLITAALCVFTLVLTSCGGDDSAGPGFGDLDADTASLPNNVDVCSLLTDAELTAVLGEALLPDESEPAGPFTGCSWGTGTVLISVAQTGSIILAPGEDECPSADLGDESYSCEGRVKFLTGDTHVSVSTIDPFVTEDQLLTFAATVLPKIGG